MWRLRSIVSLGAFVAVLVLGTAVAFGSHNWWWNAQIDVEGTDVRTVWSVHDDPDGAGNYEASITLTIPNEADASIVSQSSNETVELKSNGGLECTSQGIEAKAVFRVYSQEGPAWNEVVVSVTADGTKIGSGTGALGGIVQVDVLIPGTC